MARTQKNKATSYHLGQLKAKLAKLKRELLTPSSSGGGGGCKDPFLPLLRTMALMASSWFRCGEDRRCQCGLYWLSFSRKKYPHEQIDRPTLRRWSQITLSPSSITNQSNLAAAYEFTTLTTVPGQVQYNGAAIQMLDLPGIIQGAKDGKGRGRQVIAVAKTCHLIFIVLDVNKPLTDKKVIETELEGFGIRINKEPPNIVYKKKDKGGIAITNTVPLTHISHDVVVPPHA